MLCLRWKKCVAVVSCRCCKKWRRRREEKENKPVEICRQWRGRFEIASFYKDIYLIKLTSILLTLSNKTLSEICGAPVLCKWRKSPTSQEIWQYQHTVHNGTLPYDSTIDRYKTVLEKHQGKRISLTFLMSFVKICEWWGDRIGNIYSLPLQIQLDEQVTNCSRY